jgi:plasmid segregation protein ParM
MIIGVDVGYGYTKAVNENGEKVIFPSVVGTGFERKMEKMMYDVASDEWDNHDLIIHSEELQHYFVGNLAMLQSRDAVRPFSDERTGVTGAEEIKPQLLTAVGLLCKDEPVTLVTGLPLEYFLSQAAGLKSSLERLSGVKITLNGKTMTVVFEKVTMFPQAMGALYGRLLRNKIGMSGIVGLIDVGFKTTDIILFDMTTRKVLEGYNDTILVGTNDIVVGVQNLIKQDAGAVPNPEWIEQAIIQKQPLYFNRKEYDVARMAAEQEKVLANVIVSRVGRRWGDLLKRINIIFLAGGGATYLQDAISRIARYEVLSDSQFANADGFRLKGMSRKEPETHAKTHLTLVAQG